MPQAAETEEHQFLWLDGMFSVFVCLFGCFVSNCCPQWELHHLHDVKGSSIIIILTSLGLGLELGLLEHTDYTKTCTSLGLTYRVGGRRVVGKDPTYPT